MNISTIGEFMKALISQCPELTSFENEEKAKAISDFLRRYSPEAINRLWQRFDDEYEEKYAPSVSVLRGLAKSGGIKAEKQFQEFYYLFRCRSCFNYLDVYPGIQSEDHKYWLCQNCKSNDPFDAVQFTRPVIALDMNKQLSRGRA